MSAKSVRRPWCTFLLRAFSTLCVCVCVHEELLIISPKTFFDANLSLWGYKRRERSVYALNI
jgi:hypothetical protein